MGPYAERKHWACPGDWKPCGVSADRLYGFGHIIVQNSWREGLPLIWRSGGCRDASHVHTWPGPPLPPWGVKPTRLNRFSGRHLRRAMLPKFLTQKLRIWAIMLKHSHISRPNGR